MTGEIFERCLPEDLVQYGLIPEFIGRLPVMSAVHQLTHEDLVSILTEPRNALVKQFQRFFSFDGIELVFSDDSRSLQSPNGRLSGRPALAACARSSRRCSSRCSSSSPPGVM
jgi:ATP-dependent protease Clp ATPase subunit